MSDFVEDNVVFEGQVLKSEWLGEYVIKDGRYRLNDAETTFKVLKPLKDSAFGNVKIKHSSTGASCGMTFAMGETRLIIAYQTDNSLLQTSSCSLSGIDEITLYNYFENGKDIYIPSWGECTEEQIADPQDSNNCYYFSKQSAMARRDANMERRSEIWKARQKARRETKVINE